jgi:hypothetical protein
MGESGFAEELQTVPFDTRIRRLMGFLPSLSGSIGGAHGALNLTAHSQPQ